MSPNQGAYERMKVLESLKTHSTRKHTVIATATWGLNDQSIGDLIEFVHEDRGLITNLGIILLAEEWDAWHLQREAGHVVGPNAVLIV